MRRRRRSGAKLPIADSACLQAGTCDLFHGVRSFEKSGVLTVHSRQKTAGNAVEGSDQLVDALLARQLFLALRLLLRLQLLLLDAVVPEHHQCPENAANLVGPVGVAHFEIGLAAGKAGDVLGGTAQRAKKALVDIDEGATGDHQEEEANCQADIARLVGNGLVHAPIDGDDGRRDRLAPNSRAPWSATGNSDHP